jgi:hypothetical protein
VHDEDVICSGRWSLRAGLGPLRPDSQRRPGATAFRTADELVVAAHVDGNEKSRRAIEKYVERYNGQYEGLLRNWLPLTDTVADVHRFTISREEYFDATDR